MTVRDSAGVQLVHNGPSDAPAPLAREILRIGVLEGDPDYQFAQITSIAVDSADTVFVAEQSTTSARVYGPDGKFVRRFIRKGQGPGELERIGRVWVIGDTVAVSGMRGNPTTVLYTRSGEVTGTLSDTVPGFREVHRVARLPAGWLAYVTPRSAAPSPIQESIVLDTIALEVLDSSNTPLGPPVHRIVRRRFVPVLGDVRDPRGLQLTARHRDVVRARAIVTATAGWLSPYRGGITLFFEPAAPAAIDRRGWLYLAGQRYTIDIFDATGRLVRRVSRAHEPVEITDADIESLRGAQERRLAGPTVAADQREHRREALANELAGRQVTHFPPVSGMLVAGDGSFWARRADVESELPRSRQTEDDVAGPSTSAPSHWDRFDATGRFVGTVRLPPGFTPALLDGDGGVVTGVLKDELGVEYVVRFAATPAT